MSSDDIRFNSAELFCKPDSKLINQWKHAPPRWRWKRSGATGWCPNDRLGLACEFAVSMWVHIFDEWRIIAVAVESKHTQHHAKTWHVYYKVHILDTLCFHFQLGFPYHYVESGVLEERDL